MQTLRQVEQQIAQIGGLRDIVQSMRTLASTYLKRAEEQLDSVRLYHRTVVQALSRTLSELNVAQPPSAPGAGEGGAAPRGAPPAIVFFSTEQGLCGRFNEVMVDALQARLAEHRHARVIVLGQRGRGVVESADIRVYRSYPSVTSPDGIPPAIRRTSEELFLLYDRGDVSAIYFLHAVHQAIGRFEEVFERVLPLDVEALRDEVFTFMDEDREQARQDSERAEPDAEVAEASEASEVWRSSGNSAQPPLTYVPRPVLRQRLVEEYYFIRFYRAFLETVAAENSVRLQSMEAARANIEDTLSELEGRHRTLRQNEITEELMDVISGAEAVTRRRRRR